MSILKVDTINEKTTGSGVHIPGHVIQTVDTVDSTELSTTSDSWTDTGSTITITPKFATSKIHILVFEAAEVYGASNTGVGYRILKGATEVYNNDYDLYHSGSNDQRIDKKVLLHIESASDTSARTYTLQFRERGSGTARRNKYGGPSRMVIKEIAQ
tara:strand:- start:650 stop:1120 length:471 start_codon:yes stop_codon:yes gene_type:complete